MYRAVIIGAGKIAAGYDTPNSKKILTHAHAIAAHSDFELLGFYDSNKDKAFEMSQRWGGTVYDDMEAALEKADIVFNCVPDKFHGKILKEIARFHPRLIVSEKPITETYAEAEEIEEIFSGNIPIAVNYSRRFLKEFCLLKSQIKSYGNFLKGVGYYGKGTIHNGSHMVDLLRYLLGEATEVKTLEPVTWDFTSKDPSKDLLIKISDGIFYMNSIDSRKLEIFEMDLLFTKGRIRILEGGEKLEIYSLVESDIYPGEKNYKLEEVRYIDYSGALLGLMENIKNFFEKGEPLFCTLEDGIADLKICIS